MSPASETLGPVIGIDFDNTLVSYDDLIHSLAVERGLVHPNASKNKKLIRDAIRELPNGEIEWQKVQALVYGPKMSEAKPAEGSTEFLKECRHRGAKVHIVSHKTELANYDETGTNLRCAALLWMTQHNIFDGELAGLPRTDVYFESTRQEKLERIRQLGCTHFIDDLEETFQEESFPGGAEKILYMSQADSAVGTEVKLAGDWKQIANYFFSAGH